MSSFNEALEALKSVLDGYQPLHDFALSKWGKGITVKRLFKKRTEIGFSELPMLLIVRPSVDKFFKLEARDGKHTVNLYLLFLQEDHEKAQAELIEVEEIIDDATLANYNLGGTVIEALPTDSVNDEGQNHPVYGLAMSIEVMHRR